MFPSACIFCLTRARNDIKLICERMHQPTVNPKAARDAVIEAVEDWLNKQEGKTVPVKRKGK